MDKLRRKIAGFMVGRYGERGSDELNRFLSKAAAVFLIASLLLPRIRIFYTLCLVMLIIVYYRMISRNHGKRFQENQWFLSLPLPRIGDIFGGAKRSDRKTHRIFTCPQCRQKVRVPRGRGRIAIRCPRCGSEFVKKV